MLEVPPMAAILGLPERPELRHFPGRRRTMLTGEPSAEQLNELAQLTRRVRRHGGQPSTSMQH
jgi:hypothetical protein